MDKNKIGIIVISVILLAAAGFAGYYFLILKAVPVETGGENASQGTVKSEENKGQENGENSFSVKPVKEEIKTIIINENKVSKSEITKNDLSRIASSFAERFGSFSNQSNYTNIKDLKMFMSKRMQNWADKYVVEAKEKNPDSAIYYGITTKAIQQEVLEFDSDVGNARIMVKTQRREATGTMGNYNNFYQDIVITFMKENGIWKVDSANWQIL